MVTRCAIRFDPYLCVNYVPISLCGEKINHIETIVT